MFLKYVWILYISLLFIKDQKYNPKLIILPCWNPCMWETVRVNGKDICAGVMFTWSKSKRRERIPWTTCFVFFISSSSVISFHSWISASNLSLSINIKAVELTGEEINYISLSIAHSLSLIPISVQKSGLWPVIISTEWLIGNNNYDAN